MKNDIFCIHQVFLLIKSFWYFLHILYLSYKSTWLNYMPHVSGRRLSPKLSISYFSHHWPWFRISKELALFKRVLIYLFFGCVQFSLVAHGISIVVVGLCVWGGGQQHCSYRMHLLILYARCTSKLLECNPFLRWELLEN